MVSYFFPFSCLNKKFFESTHIIYIVFLKGFRWIIYIDDDWCEWVDVFIEIILKPNWEWERELVFVEEIFSVEEEGEWCVKLMCCYLFPVTITMTTKNELPIFQFSFFVSGLSCCCRCWLFCVGGGCFWKLFFSYITEWIVADDDDVICTRIFRCNWAILLLYFFLLMIIM